MNSTVLLTKRAAHVESMKKLVDEKPDYDTEVFERMEAELQSLDKRIEHFKLLEAQAAEEKPLDVEESKLEQRSGQEFNLCRAILRAHGGHALDGLEVKRKRSCENVPPQTAKNTSKIRSCYQTNYSRGQQLQPLPVLVMHSMLILAKMRC